MTASRDPDRLIRGFLMEGDEQLRDQVFDEVRAQIEHKPQRVFIGPWRTPIMNRIVGFGLGAVAVAAAVLVAAQLLGSPGGSGGPGEPTSTPQPTATPVPTATATPAGVPEGPFPLWNDRYAREGEPHVTVTIREPGWFGEEGDGILVKNDNSDPPDGAGMIWPFYGDLYVYADPCQWSTTKPDTPATTVDEFVAAISAQASRDATEPVDVAIDGYAGKSVTIHVPEDAVYAGGDFTDCDQGYFASWGVPGEDPARWHQGPGQIDELYVLDVDGLLTVIDISYYAGTPAEHIEEMRAIVESASFEPQ